jgi:diguanylate cyclase (GGDEF)-like protein/putative nucleotidyltransferase with HDIG domain
MGLAMFEGADADRDEIGTLAMGSISLAERGRQVAPLIRAGSWVTFAGAGLGLLGVLLPHPAEFNEAALIAVQATMTVWGLTFLALANRLPMWTVQLAPAFGVLQATLGVIFSGDPLGAYALFYLWPCLYAFYFLSARNSALTVGFVGLCYGAVLLLMDPPGGRTEPSVGDLTHQFVLTVGSLAIAGFMITALRSRVNGLWTRLSAAARTDMLTGFHNSHGLDEVLATEVERAKPDAQRVGLLTVRVGGLSMVTRRHGHAAGDEVIKEIGRLLDESTRRIDKVGRVGGAVFAIVLPETDENTGYLLAEQILARIRRTFRERASSIKASIGVAAYPKHGASAEALMQASDAAAVIGDTLGADRAVVYNPDIEGALAADSGIAPREGRANLTTVLSLAEVLELRDPSNISHSTAVARLAEMLAQELGLPEQRVRRLRLAGMLHDIGKVGIPDSILEKAGPLAPDEWDQVRRHPEMAARILGAKDLSDIREWVLTRHEQPDGHGYPRGISGDELSLEARILAVAESYDAMTSDRPYRSARDHDEAIEELGRYVGSQFDGSVVDALVHVLDASAIPGVI